MTMHLIGSQVSNVPEAEPARRAVESWLEGAKNPVGVACAPTIEPIYLDADGCVGVLKPDESGVVPSPRAQFVRRNEAAPNRLSEAEMADLRRMFPDADLWPATPTAASGATAPGLPGMLDAARAENPLAGAEAVLSAAREGGSVQEYFARLALRGNVPGSPVRQPLNGAGATGVDWLDSYVAQGAETVQSAVAALLEPMM